MVCSPATKCQHYGSEGLLLRVVIRRPSVINVMQQPSAHLQLSLGRLIAIAVPFCSSDATACPLPRPARTTTLQRNSIQHCTQKIASCLVPFARVKARGLWIHHIYVVVRRGKHTGKNASAKSSKHSKIRLVFQRLNDAFQNLTRAP
jgi:hypothetical protein